MKQAKVILPGAARTARPGVAPPVTPVPHGVQLEKAAEPPVRGAAGTADGSAWRLPSGMELTAFAMQGAFLAPGLMRRPPQGLAPVAAGPRKSSGSRKDIA